MTKVHYFQRYSTPENTVTNNTLQLLTRIYSHSVIQASKLLSEMTGESIDIGLEISQQQRGEQSVPDARIVQRSFKILIEAKVDSPVDPQQLVNHASEFNDEAQKVLLLLTVGRISKSEESAIRELLRTDHRDVLFCATTYEDICRSSLELFSEYERDIREVVSDYEAYCNDTGLFDQSSSLMRVVPCGKSFEINRKYGIYFQPTDRGYTSHSFVGIYTQKAVRLVWKIDSVFDIQLAGNRLQKTLVQGRQTDEYDEKLVAIVRDAKTECDYRIATGHRFFCGKPFETDFPKVSAGGIQGARFIHLRDYFDEIGDAETVALSLRGKDWQ